MHIHTFPKYLILINALSQAAQSMNATSIDVAAISANASTTSTTAADSATPAAANNEDDFEKLLEQRLGEEPPGEKRLSRKRRYLIFPEGSSFQLNTIAGVVDYTNYLILSITVALAWELPSKPPSEILEDVKERLKDGTYSISRNDSATNVTYVDTKPTKKPDYAYMNFKGAHKSGGGGKPAHNYYYTSRRYQPAFQTPMQSKYYHHTPRGYNSYYKQPSQQKYAEYARRKNGWRRKDNLYYSTLKQQHPFMKWQQTPYYGYTPHSKYPWWNLNSRITNAVRANTVTSATAANGGARRIDNGYARNPQQRQQQQAQQNQQRQKQPPKQQQQQPETGYRQSTARATARKHRIYPVFGKRSLPDASSHSANETTHSSAYQQREQEQQRGQPHQRERRSGITGPQLSKLDRIHIRLHRSTRQSLYEKIEKYLDKRGSHGHHCVLRALCETGQKGGERTPGSFVGELMRAVFTLPEALHEDLEPQRVEYMAQRYDTANAFSGDCAARYQLCQDSLWTSQFVA